MRTTKKTSYVNVTCSKCGRKIRTKQSDFEEGFPCPKCFAMVIEKKEEAAPAEEVAGHVLEGSGPVEICPSCSSPVNIEFEKKYLARCPVCAKFFIRQKGAPANSQTAPEENSAPKPVSEHPATDANTVMPPTPEQLSILEALHIAGTPGSIFEASEVILTVTSIAENAFAEYFSSFSFLTMPLKAALVRKLVLSELFPKLYFAGEELKYEDLSPFIDEAISDPEIKDAVKKYITEENMNSAMDYIDKFAVFIYDKKLDPDIVRLFALRAFARNFGNKLQTSMTGPLYYGSDGAKHKSMMATSHSFGKIFSKKSAANAGLVTLFMENGMGEPPAPKKRKASGCFLFLLLIPSLAGTLFFIF